MQVLVIENEETIQAIIASFMQRYGEEHGVHVQPKGLRDGMQGLFELTTNGEAYDLVILDEGLPGVSGSEIYADLVHVQPDLLGRLMFITGHRREIEERFPERDLFILDKPFQYQQFSRMITEVTGT
jgi:two-component system LytT family response regulator